MLVNGTKNNKSLSRYFRQEIKITIQHINLNPKDFLPQRGKSFVEKRKDVAPCQRYGTLCYSIGGVPLARKTLFVKCYKAFAPLEQLIDGIN